MQTQDTFNVFVYGTLMHKPILHTVLGLAEDDTCITHIHSAQLNGYKRFPLKTQVYPGVKRHSEGSVVGILLQNITALQLEVLDAFEEVGDEYERHEVDVWIPDRTDSLKAFVYVMHEKNWHVLDEENEWNVKWYENEVHFAKFFNSAKVFAQENVRRTVTLSIDQQ